MDVNYRAVGVSCGAALANAAAVASMHERCADSKDNIVFNSSLSVRDIEKRLAMKKSVRVGWIKLGNQTSVHWGHLGPMVNLRVTNRSKGPAVPLTETQIDALTTAAKEQGANFHYVPVND